jgi:hypothetical protein
MSRLETKGITESHFPIKGRGASFDPPNRFEEIHVGPPPEDLVQYFEDPDEKLRR